ncbi:MAG: LacI family DNA-binding transcriptional regulator [Saccharofermentanales bacterium]
MKITAKEIAKRLGISQSAVSLALNDKPGVSVSTREKVLAEAIRCGYSIKNHTRTVASKNIRYVIFIKNGDTVKETSFYSIVLRGIENKAKELNINVIINYFYSDGDWVEQMKTMSKDVHGLIILATEMKDNDIKKAFDYGMGNHELPIVLVDNATTKYDVDCVVSDSIQGAYNATMYLLNKGHPDIGYLRSKSRIDNFEERLFGLIKARKEFDISKEKELQIVDVNIASEKAYEDMLSWLESSNKPLSAYFADNDIIAAACIRALKTKGYRVPEDVSIIGYDDMPICTMVDPTLTTIRVMKSQLGNMAMSLLYQRMNEYNSIESDLNGFSRITISTKLIERNSVKKFNG